MAAKDHLSPHQFKFVPSTDSNQGIHSIDAYHPNYLQGQHPVGTMIWEKGSGRITNISVDENHRRQGIATQMYQQAQGYGSQPRHDVETSRTKLGKKWVKKVGGPSIQESSYNE